MAEAPHSGGGGGGKNAATQPHTYPVWIGNLNESVTESDLFKTFQSMCDSLVNCRIMVDERTGNSK